MFTDKSSIPDIISEAPMQTGAILGIRIKTISVEYGRKLNPKLIDPKHDYESIQESVQLWADVEPGQNESEAIHALQLLAEERVTERIRDKVVRLREQRDFTGKTPMLAIEIAFRASYAETTNEDEHSEITDTAWIMFKQHLDQVAATLTI